MLRWMFLVFLSFSSLAFANTDKNLRISLQQILDMASRENETLKSIELQVQSLEAEIRGRDLELSSVLDLEASQIKDGRETFSPAVRDRSQLLNLNLSKTFSTGTELNFSTGYEILKLKGADQVDRYSLGLMLQLEQNLWRNSFGRGTRLRQAADRYELEARRMSLAYEKQNYLYTIESVYWDLNVALQELEIRKRNLERSEKIASWVRARIQRSAAERTDSLQAQALVANRKLQLLTSNDRIEYAWLKVRQVLPSIVHPEQWSVQTEEMGKTRDIKSLMYGKSEAGEPLSLQALSSQALSKAEKAKAERTADTLRPKLALIAGYGRNGIEGSGSAVVDEVQEKNQDYTKIGVVFSTELDWKLKRDQRRAAELAAESQKLRSEKLTVDSRIDWLDITRELAKLSEMLKVAEEVARLQSQKAIEERKRYEQGRSTAFQAISFEVEAAEAELQVVQMLAKLRKTEAKARLFSLSGDRS